MKLSNLIASGGTVCGTSVTGHLARGISGFALLGVGLFADTPYFALRLAAVGAAMLLLRGCPMCWLMGLFDRVRARRSQA